MKDKKEDQKRDTPSLVTGNSTGEYEYSAPEVYDGTSTGEYDFGVMQNKSADEQISAANPDDEEDVGSTLLMDKPNVEKALIPAETHLAEREKMKAVVQESMTTYLIRNPRIAVLCTLLALLIALAFFLLLR